jgi:hypothetical protein
MPATSTKQTNTARLAGAVKAGNFPVSKAGPSVKNMAKMSMDKLKHFMYKEGLSIEEKKKLLYGLKLVRQKLAKENAMTLSPQEPMYLDEEVPNKERNVVAQTWTEEGDFDAHINKNELRGVEFAPQEQDAIQNYKKFSSPSLITSYMVRYESTDDFGNNTSTAVKKYMQGQGQWVFVAFAKHSSSRPEPKPEAPPKQSPPKGGQPPMKAGQPPAKGGVKPSMGSKPSVPPLKEVEEPVDNQITVTKTITFQTQTEGANILADFLRGLDL